MAPAPELYLDACATAPPAAEVLEAMAAAHRLAWANPSSLHGPGLRAAESLERSRITLAQGLGCDPSELVFTSGGSEAIHAALIGAASALPVGRLLITSVEHPATRAAAAELVRRGWQLAEVPVDASGLVDPERFAAQLRAPTRLASVIWGQSEVGTVQPIETLGALCRQAGVLLHVDAVQVVGHQPLAFGALPVDYLSVAAHKLQGPRGVGALLLRPGAPFEALIPGAGQEGGRRGGTEPVALVAGFAAAVELCCRRLQRGGGRDPLAAWRDGLLRDLLELRGVRLSGVDPFRWPERRLPHHISLLVRGSGGEPLPGRALVRALWRQGVAASSGSACSSGSAAAAAAVPAPSPVLRALGLDAAEAASGLRLSLGPWLDLAALSTVPERLALAIEEVEAGHAANPPALAG